jgi:hypothetical protein
MSRSRSERPVILHCVQDDIDRQLTSREDYLGHSSNYRRTIIWSDQDIIAAELRRSAHKKLIERRRAGGDEAVSVIVAASPWFVTIDGETETLIVGRWANELVASKAPQRND